MKKFAVAYTGFSTDEPLSVEIIEALTWKEALMMHKSLLKAWGEVLPVLPDDLREARYVATEECDFEFDVKEVQ